MTEHTHDCEALRGELVLYISGEVDPGQALRIERALIHCADCRAALASYRSLSTDLDAALALQAEVPETEPQLLEGAIWEQLEAQVAQRFQPAPAAAPRPARRWQLAAAASVAACALGGGLVLGRLTAPAPAQTANTATSSAVISAPIISSPTASSAGSTHSASAATTSSEPAVSAPAALDLAQALAGDATPAQRAQAERVIKAYARLRLRDLASETEREEALAFFRTTGKSWLVDQLITAAEPADELLEAARAALGQDEALAARLFAHRSDHVRLLAIELGARPGPNDLDRWLRLADRPDRVGAIVQARLKEVETATLLAAPRLVGRALADVTDRTSSLAKLAAGDGPLAPRAAKLLAQTPIPRLIALAESTPDAEVREGVLALLCAAPTLDCLPLFSRELERDDAAARTRVAEGLRLLAGEAEPAALAARTVLLPRPEGLISWLEQHKHHPWLAAIASKDADHPAAHQALIALARDDAPGSSSLIDSFLASADRGQAAIGVTAAFQADPKAHLAKLRTQLASQHEDVRRLGLIALAVAGDPKVDAPAMLAALRDGDAEWNGLVLGSAYRLVKQKLPPLLLQAIAADGPGREEMLTSLISGQLGSGAHQQTAYKLGISSRDPALRARTLSLAHHILAGHALRDRLRASLSDRDPRPREAAYRGLGQLPETAGELVPVLRGGLRDRELSVRVAAAWALGRFGDPKGIQPLLSALKDAERQSRKPLQVAIADALDRLTFHPQPGGERLSQKAWARWYNRNRSSQEDWERFAAAGSDAQRQLVFERLLWRDTSEATREARQMWSAAKPETRLAWRARVGREPLDRAGLQLEETRPSKVRVREGALFLDRGTDLVAELVDIGQQNGTVLSDVGARLRTVGGSAQGYDRLLLAASAFKDRPLEAMDQLVAGMTREEPVEVRKARRALLRRVTGLRMSDDAWGPWWKAFRAHM